MYIDIKKQHFLNMNELQNIDINIYINHFLYFKAWVYFKNIALNNYCKNIHQSKIT